MSVIGPVKPYFTYAAQMRGSVPIIAYHCKLYAVQKGLQLCKESSQDTTDAKNYIIKELEDLEALKKSMGDVNKEDLKYNVENFILSVFAQVDKEERTCETITKKNAIDFKRAGDFIMLLSLFGEMDDEWVKRKKYCTYKAGTIMKALKAGETPVRGNPFEPEPENKPEEEEKKEESMPTEPQEQQEQQPPTYQPQQQQMQYDYNQPSSQQQQPVAYNPSPYNAPTDQPSYQPTQQYQPQYQPEPMQQQQPVQPQPVQTSSAYSGQTLPKSGVAYFKAIEKVKKSLSASIKALNMDNAHTAMGDILAALDGLNPYMTNRQGFPGYGMGNKSSPGFQQAIAATKQKVDMAKGELDFNMVDNCYMQLIGAANTLAPFSA